MNGRYNFISNVRFWSVLLIILAFNCYPDKEVILKKDNQYLILGTRIENQIYVENNEEQANSDNLIYIPNYRMLYDYKYMKNDKSSKFKFNIGSSSNPMSDDFWSLIPSDSISEKLYVNLINASVLNPSKPRFKGNTIIKYDYLNAYNEVIFSENTSLIENHKNIWAHLPRDGVFCFIFSAPWYYIKYPLELNSTWNWTWKYDDTWGDFRYVEWDGIIQFDYSYKVTNESIFIDCPFGKVECYEIEAKGKSEIGENFVLFYFNPQLGLVKAIYTNIDKSVIELNAIEFSHFENKNENENLQ